MRFVWLTPPIERVERCLRHRIRACGEVSGRISCPRDSRIIAFIAVAGLTSANYLRAMSNAISWPDDVAEMIDDFAFLDGWEERYMHVIDLGKAMEPLDQDEMTEANKVRGCASQVWLVSDRDSDGHLVFRGDSDAHIVKGLVAIATSVFSHKSDDVVRDLDAEALFSELGLSEHLSSQRANGLRSMVARIKREAGGD